MRNVVTIFAAGAQMIAICNDGSVWSRNIARLEDDNDQWTLRKIPAVPGTVDVEFTPDEGEKKDG